jgi:hypothetical protein
MATSVAFSFVSAMIRVGNQRLPTMVRPVSESVYRSDLRAWRAVRGFGWGLLTSERTGKF